MVDDLFEVLPAPEGAEADAIVLRLHVQPGAGRTAITGRYGDALKVKVAAPPEGGRANQAVVDLVATVLVVKASQVELTSGQSSGSKTRPCEQGPAEYAGPITAKSGSNRTSA